MISRTWDFRDIGAGPQSQTGGIGKVATARAGAFPALWPHGFFGEHFGGRPFWRHGPAGWRPNPGSYVAPNVLFQRFLGCSERSIDPFLPKKHKPSARLPLFRNKSLCPSLHARSLPPSSHCSSRLAAVLLKPPPRCRLGL